MMKMPDPSVINETKKMLSGNDAAFFERVWNTSSDIYANRLKAIGFEGQRKVLDAGFGMGQWLMPLARLNESVYGIEFSEIRFEAVKSILHKLDADNISITKGSIESLPYEDDYFD